MSVSTHRHGSSGMENKKYGEEWQLEEAHALRRELANAVISIDEAVAPILKKQPIGLEKTVEMKPVKDKLKQLLTEVEKLDDGKDKLLYKELSIRHSTSYLYEKALRAYEDGDLVTCSAAIRVVYGIHDVCGNTNKMQFKFPSGYTPREYGGIGGHALDFMTVTEHEKLQEMMTFIQENCIGKNERTSARRPTLSANPTLPETWEAACSGGRGRSGRYSVFGRGPE